jgi:hypothetical protein
MMDDTLYRQTKYLVDSLKTDEVQWWHRVEKVTVEGATYYMLKDLIIPHQEVHAATTEVDGQNQYKAYQEIKSRFTQEGTTDTESMNKFIGGLTCWSHSHGNMTVGPSPQDEAQFKLFIEQQSKDDFDQIFLMMIWNKKDEIYALIYDPETCFMIENIPLIVYYPNIETDYIDDAVANKVTKKKQTYTPVSQTTYSGKNAKAGKSTTNSKVNNMARRIPSVGGLTGKIRTRAFQLGQIVTQFSNRPSELTELMEIFTTHLGHNANAIRALRMLIHGDYKNKDQLKAFENWDESDYEFEVMALDNLLNTEWIPSNGIIVRSLDVVSFLTKRPSPMIGYVIDNFYEYYDAVYEEAAKAVPQLEDGDHVRSL